MTLLGLPTERMLDLYYCRIFHIGKKGFGYLMNAEIENAEFVLHKAVKPVTAIVGGAKVSDKIQLLERLIDIMDNILIGGGMAYTFIAAQGGKIGTSLCEPDFKELALKIMEKAKNQNTKIYLPVDSWQQTDLQQMQKYCQSTAMKFRMGGWDLTLVHLQLKSTVQS